jgi:hypothetical protein
MEMIDLREVVEFAWAGGKNFTWFKAAMKKQVGQA